MRWFRLAQVAIVTLAMSAAYADGQVRSAKRSLNFTPTLVHSQTGALMKVSGKPFFILAAQMHNSSAWPDQMPAVWEAAAALHANTIEAPIYWEQLEPSRGHYDFSLVDMLISGARAHHLYLVPLWFGTWKNGQMHYVPDWMKRDPVTYPRVLDQQGHAVDDLSALSKAVLDSDKAAFVALMNHIREQDDMHHTVIMVQVENEAGLIGTARDHSREAEAAFAAPIPAEALPPGAPRGGGWAETFGPQADEMFSAYLTSRFIEEIARAGKRAYPLPLDCNVWMHYKGFHTPGTDFPSGGATWTVLDLWKRMTPDIDVVGTDVYTDDFAEYRRATAPYGRQDNASWVSEAHFAAATAPFLFDVLSRRGIGFSVFGIDNPHPDAFLNAAADAHGSDFALINAMGPALARAVAEGRVHSALEVDGHIPDRIDLKNGLRANVTFGVPNADSSQIVIGAGAKGLGRVILVQLDDHHVLVGGFNARVVFNHPGRLDSDGGFRIEEGSIDDETWHARRILNGDETDFGLNLNDQPHLFRITADEAPSRH